MRRYTNDTTPIISTNCHKTANITSFFGLNFTVYCDSDLQGHDYNSVSASTVRDCFDSCMLTPYCAGVTWTPNDQRCYRKVPGVSFANRIANPGVISVLPNPSQVNKTAQEIACPYPNLSPQTTKPGLEFSILCGSILYGDDMYNPYTEAHEWMHADTFQECLENCASHPKLCSRVTYDADNAMSLWLNCWLKTASQSLPQPPTYRMCHSAYALLPKLKQVDCRNNSQYLSGDGRIFRMSCMDQRVLNSTTVPPLARSHADSIEACMGACSGPNSNCSSIAFDVGLQSGYQNCYLFGSIPPPQQQQGNYTFMYLESMSSQYRAPPYQPSSSSTKAQIAASVSVPCGVVLILFAVYWFWYRTRGNKGRYTPVKGD